MTDQGAAVPDTGAAPAPGGAPAGVPGGIPGADDDLGHKLDIITWTLIALAAAFLGLRLWAKWIKYKGFWWDDQFLLASWLLFFGGGILGTYNHSLGFGKHVFAIDPVNLGPLSRNGNIAATLSVLAAVWSKTSFALTLLRLVKGRMRYLIWFIIISMNIAMDSTVITTWLRCVTLEDDHCVPSDVYTNYSIFAGAYSGAMDFVLALLPWKLIWSLQMKKKEKVGVAVAMSLGVVAGATAIMKCIALPTMAKGDFTYDGAQLVIWGNAEVATTIMAASIPVLRVLFREATRSAERYYATDKKTRTGLNGRSTFDTMITANRQPGVDRLATDSNRGRDDRSDKSILDETNRGPGKIVQTSEVTLEYSQRSLHDDSEGAYEMNKVRHIV